MALAALPAVGINRQHAELPRHRPTKRPLPRLLKCTAVNKDGFELDIIRREQVSDDPHSVRLSNDEDAFWVAQAPRARELLDSPQFSAVIVGANGDMARMNTLEPMVFVQFEQWMNTLPQRAAFRPSELDADSVAVLALAWSWSGLTLRERRWTCKQCGADHERDHNAAITTSARDRCCSQLLQPNLATRMNPAHAFGTPWCPTMCNDEAGE